MALGLPGNIPVAATDLPAIMRLGQPWPLNEAMGAVVIVTDDPSDPCIVWASPLLRSYRRVWQEASNLGFVEPAGSWGDSVDIDHVFPKSWAQAAGSVGYVRLFPVWSEINRKAGAGREKAALRGTITIKAVKGIVYGEELQVLKILGHDIGTARDPISIFGTRR